MERRLEQLLDLPGLPESRLPAELLDRLPARTPDPPWRCRARAVVWVQRAASPLPSSSAFAGRVRAVALGAVVDYLDSPVGPYREVFAGQLVRGHVLPVVHVPFIAVDSLASVRGGREHWALPKTVAEFEGDTAVGRVVASGAGWSVAVDARPGGPLLPLRAPLLNDQDGRPARTGLRGRGRVARVRVDAHGLTLAGWLGSGTHAGVLAEGRMVVEPQAG